MEQHLFLPLVLALIFIVAFLYSSVGHGGASGYLAILSFLALSQKEMSATALVLNILVSTVAFISYFRAGYFSFKLTLPFVIASVPFAFLGGLVHIDERTYSLLLAFALVFAAIRLAVPLEEKSSPVLPHSDTPILFHTIPAGAGIGFLSGIVGIGGGIFLSPLIILMRWADTKKTSATASFFILVNSISGLWGRLIDTTYGSIQITPFIPFLISAFIGGLFGAYFGSKKFSGLTLRRLLAVVLIVSAVKLMFST